MPTSDPVVNVCIKLLRFTKHNAYPEVNSDGYIQFTNILDELETTLWKYCWTGPNTFVKGAEDD